MLRNIIRKPNTRNEHGNSLNIPLDVITALFVWLAVVVAASAALALLGS